jgi:hypothetical protein
VTASVSKQHRKQNAPPSPPTEAVTCAHRSVVQRHPVPVETYFLVALFNTISERIPLLSCLFKDALARGSFVFAANSAHSDALAR